jgi:hypothetical protein
LLLEFGANGGAALDPTAQYGHPIAVAVSPSAANSTAYVWNPPTLYQINTSTWAVSQFNVCNFVTVNFGNQMAIGPDGSVYLSAETDDVNCGYNSQMNAWGVIIQVSWPLGSQPMRKPIVSSGGGGLGDPRGLAFGVDGNLYVADYSNDKILRYTSTGTPLGAGGNGSDAGSDATYAAVTRPLYLASP